MIPPPQVANFNNAQGTEGGTAEIREAKIYKNPKFINPYRKETWL